MRLARTVRVLAGLTDGYDGILETLDGCLLAFGVVERRGGEDRAQVEEARGRRKSDHDGFERVR